MDRDVALFEKPFRYETGAEPSDNPAADVAVVDSVTATDPAPAPAAATADPIEPAAPSAPVASIAVVEAAVQPPAVAAPEQGLRPAGEPGGLIEFARVVPREAKSSSARDTQRLISAIDDADPVLDQLRSLAASLHQARSGREMKVIAVTSSVSGEGKTLLAANLALTLSRSYMRQVLMIDADLRRPNLHRLFGTPSGDGIRSAIESVRDGRPVAVQEVGPRLALLPAGKPVRDPISVLASDAMQRLMAGANAAFDWIVLDTPPVGMLPDVGLLSSLSDAVLLVVESGRVRFDLVQRTVESIGADRIFGVVLNKVPEHEIVAAYGMHYYAPYR
jgi:capsular exopolysaccharide synthesis family protein